MGFWSKLKSYFKKTTTDTSTNGVKLTGGYAGGIEAHRTPSGYVPPPSGSYSGGTSGGTSYTGGGGTTAEIIAQQEDISPIQELEATKQDLTSIQKLEASKEGYSQQLGAFISPSPTGYGATGYIRQPTKKERIKIEEAQEKGRVIRKAGVTEEVQEFLKDIPEAISPEEISTTPPDIAPTEFGMGDIYKSFKDAITKPLIIKDIPVVRKVPEIIYDVGEGTAKGLLKIGYKGGEEILTTKGYVEKSKLKTPQKWLDYDRDTPLYLDPDVQTAVITGATLGLAGAGKVGAEILKYGGRAFGVYTGVEAIKNPTEENLAMALLFTLPEAYTNRGKIVQEFSGKKPSQIIPNKNDINYVSRTSRQRATVMINDGKGNYLVSKKGISAGGDMKKGSAEYNAIREMKEELGISPKDLEGFKFKEKIVTPEETFHVFEGTLKKNVKIKPRSDMKDGIKWVSKSEYKGVTGQTFRNPVEKSGVRIYELAIMNRLSGNKNPVTWLGYNTKYGKVYFGTQSRYDVPGKIAKEYAKLPEEMLIHATPNIPFKTEFGIPLKVKRSKIKRGKEGLYVQPPVSTKDILPEVFPIKLKGEKPAGYVGLSYLDLGVPARYDITFNPFVNLKRRGLYVLKGKVGKDIKLTKKALRGTESEQAIKYGRELKKKGRGEFIWIGGKKVRIREVILDEQMKSTEPLIKKGEKKKSKPSKDETDLDKFLKDQEKKQPKRKIKVEEGHTEYVTPYKFARGKRTKEIPQTKDVDLPRDLLREVELKDIPESPRTPPRSPPRSTQTEPPSIPPYIPKSPPREPPRSPPRMPPIIPKLPPRIGRKRMIVSKDKKAPSYDVFVKPPKRKKFLKVTKSPVGLIEARDTRNYFIDETTSRSGYLKPRKVKPSPLQFDIPKNYARDTQRKFRTFKQKKGKRTKLPKERVIERGKFLIDTKGEKQQLDIFKAMARSEKRKQRKSSKPVGLSFA
ncbi:hypothetical protein LCGC14_1254720 [marine sediment metagenome]|uniref:Uncharacterized protein n=1 Tax=marine sediment metagenome TaxID=412755 RepID=A0A0F9L5D4_9ZZZZ